MRAKCLIGIFILSVLFVAADKSHACGNQAPEAILSVYPDPQVRGEQVTFNASASYDPDGGSITEYCWWWNWPGTGHNCESYAVYGHIYTCCGEYTIKLKVTDDEDSTGDVYYYGLDIIPPAPNLVSPDNGSTCHSAANGVRLVWNSVSDIDYYKVYFGDTDPPSFYCNRDSNFLDINSLQPATTYYWKVRASSNNETSYDSSLWSFSTEAGKAIYPEPNGMAGQPIDVILNWTSGFGAESHNIYFGTDFNDVNDADIASSQFRANTAVDVNYYDTMRTCAFLLEDGKMADIGSLGRAYQQGPNTITWAEAFAINESGRIVGVSYDLDGNPHAFINIPGEGSEPNWTSPLTDLHTFSGVNQSFAYDISDANRIVGSAGDKAFYLKYPGDMNELPSLYSETDYSSVALAVIDGTDGLGPVAVGWSGGRAVLWDNLDSNEPNIYEIGTVKQYHKSRVYNINKYRQVVGYYWPMYGDDPEEHAFVGDMEKGLTDIGTLQQGNVSRAYGINSAGQVVGEATVDSNDTELTAFIYDDCKMLNLNELIKSDSNDPCYIFVSARGINDDGYIVGYGRVSDSNDPVSNFNRAILLIPIRPIAQWEFDETYGNTAPDSSIRGNHAQVYGAAWTTGKTRGALRFDGQDDYVTTASMVLDPAACDFTIAVWVKLEVNDVNQVLVAQQDGGGTGTQWLGISDNSKLSTQLAAGIDSNGTSLEPETWYHVAMTKSAGKVNFYLNGCLDGAPNQTIGEVDSATGNMVFGSNKGCDNDFFNGVMDDLRIYPWKMTHSEIWTLYQDKNQN